MITRRVAMSDVDRMQIFYGTHVKWMDEAHVELLASLGHPLSSCFADGFATPVVAMTLQYRAPVGLDDLVDIDAFVSRAGRSSFDVTHLFRHNGELIAEGVLTHVWVDKATNRPAPLPEWLNAAVESRLELDRGM